jgi:GH18 family chitinase
MQRKLNWSLLLLVSLGFLTTASSQASKTTSSFRIVGYYSLEAAMTDSLHTIPFEKLTHINLWFLNPDSLGNFTQDLSPLLPFVKKAHAKKVKVLASIGGGSPQPQYHALLKEDKRKMLVDNLVAIVQHYDLDGIDVDLEGKAIDENYENFVTDLAAALRSRNKMITAAIAVYYKDALTDRALAQYDFVNVMSYDRTGPWRPEIPGPHATYAHAVEDLDYFSAQRQIPKEKMTLGVPFYGYGFGPDSTSQAIGMDYGQIVMQFPGAELSDEIKMPDGKILYYNGLATIKQKTALAKEKASGIMIWQLKGDAVGQHSLLQAIHDVVNGIK